MWVWDRSIGLWLWGVFQPNQEIKCLFAQLDRPTTNQSRSMWLQQRNWTKKCRMSPDVSGTRRAQAALLPGARYEPRVSPVRGPGAPLAARPGSPAVAARELRTGDDRMKPALTIWFWSSVHHRMYWSGWFSYHIIFPTAPANPRLASRLQMRQIVICEYGLYK